MVVYIPPISLLLLLVLFSLLLMRALGKRQKKQLPPGPPRLPILGNLHQLGTLLHRSLWHLSKKYGPVMFLQLGSVPTVVISSAEAAKQALKDHDLDCCSRPNSAGPRRLSYNHLDISFSPYGHHWREMRKLCVLQLLSAKRLQESQHIREEEVDSLVNSITQSSSVDAPVDLTEKSFSLAGSIVFKAAFGTTFHGKEFNDARLQEVVDDAIAMLGVFPASDFFPFVGFIIDRLTGLQGRLEKSFHEMDTFFQHLIDNHSNNIDGNKQEQDDIVDVLLRVERERHELGAVQFSKDHIKAILMDIFLAGIGTSAITIIWAMAELARNPRIMMKAQQEVRSCIGKKERVAESDIEMLNYLRMIVKETLRLYPASPVLLREASSHFKLNGYDVYPKTRILINVWAIGRDPDHWNNPEEFFPERFSDNSIDYKGPHFEFIPFGAGRRSCPGMVMGTTTVELALANLLCCFNWKLPTGTTEADINMEDGPGLALPKKTALHLVPIKYQWQSDNV